MSEAPEIKTLDWEGKPSIIVRVTEETASKCSVTSTPMQVTVEVVYAPDEKLMELVSFRKYVNWYASDSMHTLEEIAVGIADAVYKAVEPKFVIVGVRVKTAEHGVAGAVAAKPDSLISLVSEYLLFTGKSSIKTAVAKPVDESKLSDGKLVW